MTDIPDIPNRLTDAWLSWLSEAKLATLPDETVLLGWEFYAASNPVDQAGIRESWCWTALMEETKKRKLDYKLAELRLAGVQL